MYEQADGASPNSLPLMKKRPKRSFKIFVDKIWFISKFEARGGFGMEFLSRWLGIFINPGIYIPGDWWFSKIWGLLSPELEIFKIWGFLSPGIGDFYLRKIGNFWKSGGFYLRKIGNICEKLGILICEKLGIFAKNWEFLSRDFLGMGISWG